MDDGSCVQFYLVVDIMIVVVCWNSLFVVCLVIGGETFLLFFFSNKVVSLDLI